VDFNPTRRMVAMRLAVAAGIPILGIGLPFALAFARDHSPTGGAWTVLGWLVDSWLYVAACFAPFAGCNRRRGFGAAAGVAVVACWLLTSYAEEEWTLADRGLTDHCLVVAVTEEQSSADNATATHYVQHLQCPHGPDTTVDGGGDKGTFVTVLWDPSHRIGTQPARHWIASGTKLRLAVGAASAGTCLVLLDLLIDVRRRPAYASKATTTPPSRVR